MPPDDDAERGARDAQAEERPRVHVIPLGQQVIPLPPAVQASLAAAKSLPPGALTGTRVWLEKNGEQLLLHLGDVEVSAPEG